MLTASNEQMCDEYSNSVSCGHFFCYQLMSGELDSFESLWLNFYIIFPFIFCELKMDSEMVLSTKIAYNIAQHHFC